MGEDLSQGRAVSTGFFQSGSCWTSLRIRKTNTSAHKLGETIVTKAARGRENETSRHRAAI
jgi:hypothetical protein